MAGAGGRTTTCWLAYEPRRPEAESEFFRVLQQEHGIVTRRLVSGAHELSRCSGQHGADCIMPFVVPADVAGVLDSVVPADIWVLVLSQQSATSVDNAQPATISSGQQGPGKLTGT